MKAQTLVSRMYAAYAATVAVIILSLMVGCTTLGPDGTRVYDPIKSDAVVTALSSPVRETITRIIKNNPNRAYALGNYFRAVGNVFCRMEAEGNFNPTWALSEIDKATGPLQQGLDSLAITAKNTIVALYAIFFAQAHSAELDPQKWPAHVAKLMCGAINGGLTDAGELGVEPKR